MSTSIWLPAVVVLKYTSKLNPLTTPYPAPNQSHTKASSKRERDLASYDKCEFFCTIFLETLRQECRRKTRKQFSTDRLWNLWSARAGLEEMSYIYIIFFLFLTLFYLYVFFKFTYLCFYITYPTLPFTFAISATLAT